MTPRSLFTPKAAGLAAAALLVCQASCVEEAIEHAPRPPIEIGESPVALKRLTQSQYKNAVHDLFHADIAVPISLEPDVAVDGFVAVGASTTSISALGVERYESAAYDIAGQAMDPGEARDAWMPCAPSSTPADTVCAREVVTRFGRRAFRRPLADDEISRYVAIADASAKTLGDFHDGLEFALAAMLMSPSFLFRVEVGEEHDGRLRYDDYEMATRLAFFLWNTTPDEPLLDAAEAGELTDPQTLAVHVDRMIADERAAQGVKAFFSDRFELYKLDDLVKDSTVFTATSAELGQFAREETLSTLAYALLDQGADYRDVFTTRTTFVNRKLASLYGVPAPALEGFARIELPEDGPRRGLLGHASLLALHAHPVSSSATLRGKFVRTALLCHAIPPPPADVDTSLPEPSGEMPTLRDRIGEHLENPTCATCHNLLDPIGLGLERFDGIGQYRLMENDVSIDASGALDGDAWTDAKGMGEVVARHPSLAGCLVRHLYRYAVAITEDQADEPLLEELTQTFVDGRQRLEPLLAHVVLSDGFRFARVVDLSTHEDEEATP